MTAPATDITAVSTARNNAELIAQCAQLGYLHDTWPTLDPTFGLGRFWNLWRPTVLMASDLDPAKSPLPPEDFTRLPYLDDTFAAVVFDPPYKLNGTSTGRGAAACDDDYGVAGAYASVDDRHALIRAGITECLRVLAPGRRTDRTTGGFLLVKCQDQVNGGRVRWQTHEFTAHACATPGVRLVDALFLVGHRPQPPGRSQQHARRNYSTLLVLRKEA